MKNLYVELVPYQRDTKNGGERDKNLGNVNSLHVNLLHVQMFNPFVLKLFLPVPRERVLAQHARAQAFFLPNTALSSSRLK